MRCEAKACVNQALEGGKYCLHHRLETQRQPAPPPATASDDEIVVINVSDIPAPRTNEAALSLLNTIKKFGDGKALKVKQKKFSKPCLMTTQRYALTQGLRIGVRFIGEWAYIWKLTPEQVKAAEQKAERLVKAREKKKTRAAHA